MNFSKKVNSFVLAVLLVLGMVNIGYLLGVSNLVFASVSSPISGPISAPIVTPTPTPSPTPTPTIIPSPTPTSIPVPAGPNIQITYPVNGMMVMPDSIVSLQATASASAGVNRVVFQVNGNSICTDFSVPYACDWKVPSVSPATYKITGWVIDNAGNKKSVTVNVTAGPNIFPVPTPTPVGDTTKPTVSILSPLNNSQVVAGSKVEIKADASDAQSGINRVVILVNGSSICTDSNTPYSCNWTVPAVSGATYTITVWAIDNAGNKQSSSVVATSQ